MRKSIVIAGMAESFEAVREKMRQSAPAGDRSDWIRSLDARQRKVLPLFDEWAHFANTPRRAIDRPVQTKAVPARRDRFGLHQLVDIPRN